MEMQLFNSLSKNKEDFKPIDGNKVRMYSCGPTVYNYAHIGNMRAFLFADLMQRVLRVVGNYDLQWVMNITNIDDKTIRDSAVGSDAWIDKMGQQTDNPLDNLKMLTDFYEKSFLDDISKLGINPDDFNAMPRATDYVEQMQDLIRKIYENGFAYVSEGSVYFNVDKWSKADTYGKLHKIDFDNFRAGVRIDADQYEREQVSDFVLWKAKKDGEPFWEFEIDGHNCPGRPGWHIECSAMEYDILGVPFDIHTGGIDLKFPHHEDEIAQSKAGYNVEPTAFWCHNEFLEVEGEKMSKSKGNFFTLRDLLDKGIDPLDIRFAMQSQHYATTYNFTFDGISAAHKGRFRVQEYIYELFNEAPAEGKAVDVEKLKSDVYKELANDLHTPKALAVLFTFINNNNAKELNTESREKLKGFFTELNKVFAIWEISEKKEVKADYPAEVLEWAEQRISARKDKNWAEADKLRDLIKEAGYVVKDTKGGFELEKI